MDLSKLQALAAASEPMASDSVPILHGRTLYLDADGLAYYCAGNDETLVSEARSRMRSKIAEMLRASMAEKVVLLLTGSGGHKGHRYAVARVKPYQGQRSGARRPRNWKPLRDMLEAGDFGPTIIDYDREADDRFGQFGWADPANTVIGTQDKDMRMVPGWHIDWKDNRMFYLGPDVYEATFNDKVFGRKWFWLQMLHGDPADFIPGLPKAYGKLCGPVAAENILRFAATNEQAASCVYDAYASHYKERALVEMAEQAILLWMRKGEDADWFEAVSQIGPLRPLSEAHPEYHYLAWKELSARVRQAQELNALSTQDD